MDDIKMTLKEAERLSVMRQLDKGQITIKQASLELGISPRQTKRIRKRYREYGEKGVISLKRGVPSMNVIPEEIKKQVLHLLKNELEGFGPTLAQEKLQELYNIQLSRETIRQWMIEIGTWHSKRKKERKVYQRRERRPRFGEMIQGDGSLHAWLEDRSEKMTLIMFVDDATSKITEAKFFPTETTNAYLECLTSHMEKYGKPLSLYVDKHNIFRVNREELKNGIGITHFGKVLKELGIELICAHSPQAKGRIERKNGVLQDRLIKEMRLAGIATIEEANGFLPGYIERHNRQFGKKPLNAEDAHRPLREKDALDRIMARQERRKLSKNLTFQYKNVLYQIQTDTPNRLRQAYVDIYWKEGESIEVEYNGNPLKYTTWNEIITDQPRILDAKELEALWKPRAPKTPTLKHPWKQGRRIG